MKALLFIYLFMGFLFRLPLVQIKLLPVIDNHIFSIIGLLKNVGLVIGLAHYSGTAWVFFISPITKVLCALPMLLMDPRWFKTKSW